MPWWQDMCSQTGDGPPGLRRCGFRQDRGRHARRLPRHPAGKQVAVLVPTTLLAQQHYNSFCDRFADWPVQVEVISRFKRPRNIAAVSAAAGGQRPGRHPDRHPQAAAENIKYRDLGLLIIDEEHRFGVKQKETIKALRSEVDILTLTATPIPRTLNMALGGMRDLSIIATPPRGACPSRTFVRPYNIALVKEAILRETLRGGQVYYLHNEVKRYRGETAQAAGTGAGPAHRRGPRADARAAAGAGDVGLLPPAITISCCAPPLSRPASTSPMPTPSSSTARTNSAWPSCTSCAVASAAPITRPTPTCCARRPSAVTGDAEKRLEAIEAAGDLGAGYLLATHDLEIRGAGELLGDEQSGQIQSVGYSPVHGNAGTGGEIPAERRDTRLRYRPGNHGTPKSTCATGADPG